MTVIAAPWERSWSMSRTSPCDGVSYLSCGLSWLRLGCGAWLYSSLPVPSRLPLTLPHKPSPLLNSCKLTAHALWILCFGPRRISVESHENTHVLTALRHEICPLQAKLPAGSVQARKSCPKTEPSIASNTDVVCASRQMRLSVSPLFREEWRKPPELRRRMTA